MSPSGLTLAMTLTLNFQGQTQNLLYLSQKSSHCHETKSKHIDWTQGLKWDHHLWPWPWPWPWFFKVNYVICYISAKNRPIATKQKTNISIELKASNVTITFDLGHDLDLIFHILYLSPKWSDFHGTKGKHIDWTLGLKCDHQVWPWPWAWPWIFNVKYGICYISTKKGQITMKRKANISNELQASNVTNGFDLGNDLNLWIFKVKCDLYLWPYACCWLRIFMVKFWNSCISEWDGRLTLNKGGGSRSFMTMTVAIWWPRSGERVYRIETGLTSDVGVPSTHPVSHNMVEIIQCMIPIMKWVWTVNNTNLPEPLNQHIPE